MKMKWLVAVFALVMLHSAAWAQGYKTPKAAITNREPWGITISSTFMSSYDGSIVGGVFYKGPFNFTSLTAAKKNALGRTYFDITAGTKLDGIDYNDTDGGRQYNFTVGHIWSLGPESFPVNFDASVSYQMVGRILSTRDDVFQAAACISLPKVPVVQPYVCIFDFERTGSPGIDNGLFVYFGAVRNQDTGLKFREKPVVANLDFRVGYSDGCFNTDASLVYYRLTLGTTLDLGRGWKVTPSIWGQIPSGDARPGHAFIEKNRVCAMLGISKSF